MADTCDRCYRPKATYEAWCTVWWLGPPHAVCGIPATAPHIWHRMMDDDCAAARDRWLTAEVARLQAELADLRADVTAFAENSLYRPEYGAGDWREAGEQLCALVQNKAAAEAALGGKDGK